MGDRIDFTDGRWVVPDRPVIPFIEGDGTGPDIWRASRRVFDAVVEKVSGGKRQVEWLEVLAGEKAFKQTGNWLPEATLDTIRRYRVAIKGPLTTPVGGGIRSLNVALRQLLDLYACIRPVRYFAGVPSPMREPEKLDVVIYRENTEDVYTGVEYAAGSPEATRLLAFLRDQFGAKIRDESALGIKPMSRFGTQRLVAKAIQYAIKARRPSVTLVHKGNIMKFTEGAFREWGYEVARDRFGEQTFPESDGGRGKGEKGRVIVKDRIADSMFQQVLLRPEEYSVIATPNLNGDYLSDACVAQIGGLGMAPGGNVGDGFAVFEATHGTAPKYAGLDKVNPGAVLLSGAMMFEELGWSDAADAIIRGLSGAIAARRVAGGVRGSDRGAQRPRRQGSGAGDRGGRGTGRVGVHRAQGRPGRSQTRLGDGGDRVRRAGGHPGRRGPEARGRHRGGPPARPLPPDAAGQPVHARLPRRAREAARHRLRIRPHRAGPRRAAKGRHGSAARRGPGQRAGAAVHRTRVPGGGRRRRGRGGLGPDRQGRHVRLGRHFDQAGAEHGRHEV